MERSSDTDGSYVIEMTGEGEGGEMRRRGTVNTASEVNVLAAAPIA